MGVNVDGVTYYCHEFLNANNLDAVYMSNPNLPLRYEISNDGTGAASTLEHICTSVVSEGGFEPTGLIRSASTNGTHVDAAVENTIYAVVGMRLKSTHLAQSVDLLSASLQLHSATDQCEWMVLFNPTVADTFTYNGENNSAIEIARGATANTVTLETYTVPIAIGYIESGAGQTGSVQDRDWETQ